MSTKKKKPKKKIAKHKKQPDLIWRFVERKGKQSAAQAEKGMCRAIQHALRGLQ